MFRYRVNHVGTALILTFLSIVSHAEAQEADPADVSSLDAIMRAYYEVVSGPAGERADARRDSTLHLPGASIGFVSVDSEGNRRINMMDLAGYYGSNPPRSRPFYEWEINRETATFGAVTHVWSTYVSSREPGGEPFDRGINSVQLYNDGERWWIIGWVFDRERSDNPIPAKYLP